MTRGRILFVIGVAGSGKSTVAGALAQHFGGELLEGDRFHPAENVKQMRAGKPLSDEMRWEWLSDLAKAADEVAGQGDDVFVACSGLKKSHRDRLRQFAQPCQMVFLHGGQELISKRMASRQDHYMPVSLLNSQFQDLEPPQAGENDIVNLAIVGSIDQVIEKAKILFIESK